MKAVKHFIIQSTPTGSQIVAPTSIEPSEEFDTALIHIEARRKDGTKEDFYYAMGPSGVYNRGRKGLPQCSRFK